MSRSEKSFNNNFTKIELTSLMAHFKNSRNGKNQNTFKVPPLSTIIGILKNIYGEDINNFIFGYTFSYARLETQIETIYKELNPNVKNIKTDKDRFTADICNVQYLINPMLNIYTNIQNEININECLNMGKSNCLTKCSKPMTVEIKSSQTVGNNQWCPVNIGQGIITRINKETVYNKTKRGFNYYGGLFRLNEEFDSNYTIVDCNEGIQLWKYEGIGDIECYQEEL